MTMPNRPICPQCQSHNVAEILYGMPAFSEELEHDLDSGKIVLGGCFVSEGDAKFQCADCGTTWPSATLGGFQEQ
jgi:hypothetical protein